MAEAGDIHGPKPYEFIGFGDLHGPKPCELIGFGDLHGCSGKMSQSIALDAPGRLAKSLPGPARLGKARANPCGC